jgi:hypothetical protein
MELKTTIRFLLIRGISGLFVFLSNASGHMLPALNLSRSCCFGALAISPFFTSDGAVSDDLIELGLFHEQLRGKVVGALVLQMGKTARKLGKIWHLT